MLIDVLFFTSRKRHAAMLEYSEKIKYKKVKTTLKKKKKSILETQAIVPVAIVN